MVQQTYLGGGVCAVVPTSEELYHFGIQGMKWGVQNGPPYPLKPGARSSAEKKAKTPIAEKYADYKVKKKKKSAVRKAQVTRKKKAKYEADRRKTLNEGSADDILKSRSKYNFSNDELERAVKRIQWENRLTDLAADSERSKNGRRAAESMLSNGGLLGRLKEYTGNIAGVIDNFNKIEKGLRGNTQGKDKQYAQEKLKLENEKLKMELDEKKKKAQEVSHSGIAGQKWGVRNFRGYDGKLTPAGQLRYKYWDTGANDGSGGRVSNASFAYNEDEDEVYVNDGKGNFVPLPEDYPNRDRIKEEAKRMREYVKKAQNQMQHSVYLGAGIYSNELIHKRGGKKGMKWGYTKGAPNGKRKAGENTVLDTIKTGLEISKTGENVGYQSTTPRSIINGRSAATTYGGYRNGRFSSSNRFLDTYRRGREMTATSSKPKSIVNTVRYNSQTRSNHTAGARHLTGATKIINRNPSKDARIKRITKKAASQKVYKVTLSEKIKRTISRIFK